MVRLDPTGKELTFEECVPSARHCICIISFNSHSHKIWQILFNQILCAWDYKGSKVENKDLTLDLSISLKPKIRSFNLTGFPTVASTWR